jgi:hypothetical protein
MTFDMDEVIQEHQDNAQAIEPTLWDENAPLKCSFLGCPELQLFSTRAALK